MRAFDLIVACAGVIIISPLYLIIATLIKIYSSGPILYTQERVGHHGRIFRLYKFRTMVDNADQIGTSVTTGDDPRITKLGRILRKTKMDELPQLWNVLIGDMSLVGPRPEVPEIVDRYSSEMKKTLEVRPGITSNATLHLRNEEELLMLAKDPDRAYEEVFVPAKVSLAMEHVKRKSFLFDFSILIKTIWALTGGKIWMMREHPFVSEIKQNIIKSNQTLNEKMNNHKQI